jgi:hypothetical protein
MGSEVQGKMIVCELERQKERQKERPAQLVERHAIKRADSRFTVIDHAAFASRRLDNAANYLVWQPFILEG